MSQRYLLISGEEDALNVVIQALWNANNKVEGDPLVTIEGVYFKPTRHCGCPRKQREDMKNWVKAKKWGIPICHKCRRPSRFWIEGIMKRLTLALGNSELEGDS